ncbi:helix-turn-helix domain-containing protein [Nocardioides sp. C4-1]|uniref:helix-turn-helix domain-containing protein n=1 Tax=Nocardioides sp. C4-1 TaxID=3151851 RepID=UPI00326668FB
MFRIRKVSDLTVDGLVDSEAAARLLGVSARRVNQLADAGEITKAARGLYDRMSIERYAATRRTANDRAWSANTAWAAVAMLSDGASRASWLPERSAYRLAATLRAIDVEGLVSKARGRATVNIFDGHASAARGLRTRVIARDWSALGLVDEITDGVDGYVAGSELAALGESYALVPSARGNVTLRATGFDLDVVRALATDGDVLVALDAAGSVDVRTRGVGERALDRALTSFRERSSRTSD